MLSCGLKFLVCIIREAQCSLFIMNILQPITKIWRLCKMTTGAWIKSQQKSTGEFLSFDARLHSWLNFVAALLHIYPNRTWTVCLNSSFARDCLVGQTTYQGYMMVYTISRYPYLLNHLQNHTFTGFILANKTHLVYSLS